MNIMEKIRLCIFDMDGLLIDTERYVWPVCQKRAGIEQGVEISDEFIRSLIGSNAAIFKTRVNSEFQNILDTDKYVNRVYELTEQVCMNDKIPLRPGVLKVLNFCKENDIKMTIGTSTKRRIASKALANSGLKDYFEYVVYGEDVKSGKPDPETYLKSVEYYGLKPNECLVFEDSPTGAKAAYNGNIPLVFVEDLIKPTELENEKAFKILHQIDEIIPIIKKINGIG